MNSSYALVLAFLFGFSIGILFTFSQVFTFRRLSANVAEGFVWPRGRGLNGTEMHSKALELVHGIWQWVSTNVSQISFNDSHFHEGTVAA